MIIRVARLTPPALRRPYQSRPTGAAISQKLWARKEEFEQAMPKISLCITLKRST
jgi:hypothetical protein